MRIRYFIYQIKCRIAHKLDVDYVEWLSDTLFAKGVKEG